MNPVFFAFGVHNHQPVGNFDFVFETAYQMAYRPFLEAMERHPTLAWNLHATGILWEWLEAHHPDYLQRVGEQVQKGRIELLTGGYYEPILATIPDADKIGQIKKLTTYIEKKFRVTPKGLWLAERVWEPHLAQTIAQSGVSYILLDDTHFLATGLTPESLTGAYVTEEQGHRLKVLPIRKELRYAIPFKDPEATIEILRRTADLGGPRLMVMLDDGEKFGLWPETNKHVYTDRWFDRFLSAIEANSSWIRMGKISDFLDNNPPQGRVYLPATSYFEMGEWSLPAAGQKALGNADRSLAHHSDGGHAFLRGGFWRNFLTRYEESNAMHKKMMRVSDKAHRAAQQRPAASQDPKTQGMLDMLWAGQCNCAYWHGVFGGLYLPHLRQSLYRCLLHAENSADEILGNKVLKVEAFDYDGDGNDEILIETQDQNLYIAPAQGGTVVSWDLRKAMLNALNVLTRRPEAYHQKLIDFANGAANAADVRVKEPGLEKRLYTDWYRRSTAIDHFLRSDTTLQTFSECRYGEQGDFVNGRYEPDLSKGNGEIRLSRVGTVWSGEQRNDVKIEKTFKIGSDLKWSVSYRLTNVQGLPCQVRFAPEFSFAFHKAPRLDPTVSSSTSRWEYRDEVAKWSLSLRWSVPTEVWDFPLETVSISEHGFERTYQGTVILPVFNMALSSGEIKEIIFDVEAGS